MKKNRTYFHPIFFIFLLLLIFTTNGCGSQPPEQEAAGEEEAEQDSEIRAYPDGPVLFVQEEDNPLLSHKKLEGGDFNVLEPDMNIAFAVCDRNVRKYPSLASECLGKVPLGSWLLLEGISEDGGFYEIGFENGMGFVRSDLLPHPEEEEAAAAEASADGENREETANAETAGNKEEADGAASGHENAAGGEASGSGSPAESPEEPALTPEEEVDIFWDYVNSMGGQ